LIVVVQILVGVFEKEILLISMIGSAIVFFANLVFYFKFFKFKGAQQAKKIISSVYIAAAQKFLVLSLMLYLVFSFNVTRELIAEAPALLILGMAIACSVHVFGPMFRLAWFYSFKKITAAS
jgi:F0F1-type ATP synthase assembly protein I